MKLKLTLSSYFLGIAIMLFAFSACSTGTHITKCPDFKGQQEQARVSKKKVKKQGKTNRKVENRRLKDKNIEKKQDVLVLLDKRELLQIPNSVNQAVAISETAKTINIEPTETATIIDQLPTLDRKKLTTKEVQKAGTELMQEFNAMSKVEQKAKKKEMRKAVKSAVKQSKHGGSDPDLLLIILAVLLPPLGMFLYEDAATDRFWISLILTILGYFPGLIYTLYIILTER